MKALAWIAVVVAILSNLPGICAADPAAVPPPVQPDASSPANIAFARQFQFTASLGVPPPGYPAPEILATLKNNPDRTLELGLKGTQVCQYTVDYLPDGQNPAQTTGWLRLRPNAVASLPPVKGDDVVTVTFQLMARLEQSVSISAHIRPTDFTLTNPGYYRFTISMHVIGARSFDGGAVFGPHRNEDLMFHAAPLIIHRSDTGFEAWPPLAKSKQ